jgi:hypothetical protein
MIDKKKLIVRNGKVMAVIRPSDPQRALDKARAIIGMPYEQGQKAMDEILQDPTQTYTFMGLAMKKHGKIVDPQTGAVVGKTQPGDSFVAYEQILTRAATEAAWAEEDRKKGEPS